MLKFKLNYSLVFLLLELHFDLTNKMLVIEINFFKRYYRSILHQLFHLINKFFNSQKFLILLSFYIQINLSIYNY